MTTVTATPAPTRTSPALGAGAALLASALLSVVGYVVLGSSFGWPDVLDEPGTSALDRYLSAEPAIRAGFYVMTLASLLMVPAAHSLQQVHGRDGALARTVTTLGVLGAFAQMLGWLRWVVAVPVQAAQWATGDESARPAVATTYDTLNAYAGGTVGEHLGWLLQGLWAVGVFTLLHRAGVVPRWVTAVGLALSVGWAVLVPLGTAADVDWAETAGVAVLYTAWYVWLAVTGTVLLVRGRRAADD